MLAESNRPKLTDAEIRKVIHSDLIPSLVGNDESRILDEMAVCDARIDIAVINGHFHGFEIKSEADTLERLSGQAATYSKVFDTVAIICGKNHFEKVAGTIPGWWGIYSAEICLGRVLLTRLRCSEMNPSIDPYSLAQLLWKEELKSLLSEAGFTKGISGKPCRVLWQIVADVFPVERLRERVRDTLKFRETWRLPLPQT